MTIFQKSENILKGIPNLQCLKALFIKIQKGKNAFSDLKDIEIFVKIVKSKISRYLRILLEIISYCNEFK